MDKYLYHNKLHSLLKLLDDPDQEIYKQVSNAFTAYGTGCIDVLEQLRFSSNSAVVSSRVEEIIRRLRFNEIALELQSWKAASGALMDGLVLLTKYEYPDYDAANLRKTVHKLVRNIWLELNPNLTAFEEIKILNHILFEIYGFRVTEENATLSTEGYFLKDLIEHKKAHALVFTSFYIALCELLNIPVKGISLQGLLLAAYTVPAFRPNVNSSEQSDLLFYIDPSDRGEIFIYDVISQYLESAGVDVQPVVQETCNSSEILQKIIDGLCDSCLREGKNGKAADMKKLYKLLSINSDDDQR